MALMTSELIDDLCLVLRGDLEPDDEAWRHYVALSEQGMRRSRENHRQIIFSEGGSPTPSQRQELAEVLKRVGVPTVAIITPSRLVRGVATALAWNGLNKIRVFDPDELGEARKYLGIDEVKESRALTRARMLRSRLDSPTWLGWF